jgi:hypothetical protein
MEKKICNGRNTTMTSSISPSAVSVPKVKEENPVPPVEEKENIVPEVKTEKKPRGPNPWLEHVKLFKKSHPDLKYKDVLVQAKASYKKVEKK